jgi:hypothetical protein
MAVTRDNLLDISALADHEVTPLNVGDLDSDSFTWLTNINALSMGFYALEVPDPVDIDALIEDTIAEIEHDRIDRFIRFITATSF